jgi:hypothetical protein
MPSFMSRRHLGSERTVQRTVQRTSVPLRFYLLFHLVGFVQFRLHYKKILFPPILFSAIS